MPFISVPVLFILFPPFYLQRRQLAAGQVMGWVIVVIVIVLVVLKTILRMVWIMVLRGGSNWKGGKRKYMVRPPMYPKDPTPKKVLNAKSAPMSNMSWLGRYGQDFLQGWIPQSQGIQPQRKSYTPSWEHCIEEENIDTVSRHANCMFWFRV